MKRILFALSLLFGGAAGCGGGGQIRDLPLVWTENMHPAAGSAVAKALASGPLEVGQFIDGRQGEKDVVGTYEDDGFKVRTKGDVRAFWAGRLRAAMEGAGAKFGAPANARFDAKLDEFDCIEGNTFNATVRMTVTITRHDASAPWSRTYEGKGKRWGKTHKPENFNEALSAALNDAAGKLVQDGELATAILGKPAS
jgi:hypothetical protein